MRELVIFHNSAEDYDYLIEPLQTRSSHLGTFILKYKNFNNGNYAEWLINYYLNNNNYFQIGDLKIYMKSHADLEILQNQLDNVIALNKLE